jgi:hypothetical protein
MLIDIIIHFLLDEGYQEGVGPYDIDEDEDEEFGRPCCLENCYLVEPGEFRRDRDDFDGMLHASDEGATKSLRIRTKNDRDIRIALTSREDVIVILDGFKDIGRYLHAADPNFFDIIRDALVCDGDDWDELTPELLQIYPIENKKKKR